MKISHEVRDHAREQNHATGMTSEEIRSAMAEKSKEFRKSGSQIYHTVEKG